MVVKLSPGAAESLAALSTILDLANGLAPDKSVLTGLFAFELARAYGLAPGETRASFYAGLLRQLGCTAYAPAQARLGDDIALRHAMLHGDDRSQAHVVRAVMEANAGPLEGATALGRLLLSSRRIRTEWFSSTCDAARLLAEGLGLDATVARALNEMHERWDGKGGPSGLEGEACSVIARVSQAANVAVLFFLQDGVDTARVALALQSGKALDPALVKLAKELLPGLQAPASESVAALDGVLAAAPPPITPLRLAQAFGDFADLQTHSFAGHSRHVADVCAATATRLDLDAGARERLALAAMLHDLGQVATRTGLWLHPSWSPPEREAARGHVHTIERLLAGTSMLADVAPLVAAHHERLDGSGYPRCARGAAIPRAARVLATADVCAALEEPRPHRPPFSRRAAEECLRGEVRAGRLDADCVAAVVGTEPGAARPDARGPTSDLTRREVEVLRFLARGDTNKEIARSLSISPRTVQQHTLHIYEKLGVRSRAGASLVAARAGLV